MCNAKSNINLINSSLVSSTIVQKRLLSLPRDDDKIPPETSKPFKPPKALRIVRKTKKQVQKEQMNTIEQAIREGREDGLEVIFLLFISTHDLYPVFNS